MVREAAPASSSVMPARGGGGGHLGDLWSLPISAFSRRLRVALHLAGVTATHRKYISLLSGLLVWMRLGFPLRNCPKLTAPVLFAPDGSVVFDSTTIARRADAMRSAGALPLFPERQKSACEVAVAHADTLVSHARALLTRWLAAEPRAAARVMLPRWLRGWFFSTWVMRIAVYFFDRKFTAESAQATDEAARASLKDVRSILSGSSKASREKGRRIGLKYVNGEHVTYADIALAEAMFFAQDSENIFGTLFGQHHFAQEFPDLVAWALAIRQTHYPEEMLRRRKKR